MTDEVGFADRMNSIPKFVAHRVEDLALDGPVLTPVAPRSVTDRAPPRIRQSKCPSEE
jgi:hypothetical protein